MSYWDGALVGLGGIVAALILYGITWAPVRRLIERCQVRHFQKFVQKVDDEVERRLAAMDIEQLVAQQALTLLDQHQEIRNLPEIER